MQCAYEHNAEYAFGRAYGRNENRRNILARPYPKRKLSKIDFKPSIKEFLIYGLAIIVCSGVSAVLETLLKSIITI